AARSAHGPRRRAGCRLRRAPRAGRRSCVARQRAVAMLVLLARATRTGLIAAHLAPVAHERGAAGSPCTAGYGATAGHTLASHRPRTDHEPRPRARARAKACACPKTWSCPRPWHRRRARFAHTADHTATEIPHLRVLGLQRTHQPLAPLGLLAIDLLLRAHLDRGQARDRVELHPIEHRREQLEGFALVLVAVILLRIAAQMDALAQVIHRRQMLAPMHVEHAQHDLALDVSHDRGSDALDLAGVGVARGLHYALAQRRLLELALGLEPPLGIHCDVEVAPHGLLQTFKVPVVQAAARHDEAVNEVADRIVEHLQHRAAQVLGSQDLRALLVDDLTLIIGHVIEQQQLFADVEVVRLDLALRLLDLLGEHAALDDLAFLHAGELQQPLGAVGIAEDTHEVV